MIIRMVLSVVAATTSTLFLFCAVLPNTLEAWTPPPPPPPSNHFPFLALSFLQHKQQRQPQQKILPQRINTLHNQPQLQLQLQPQSHVSTRTRTRTTTVVLQAATTREQRRSRFGRNPSRVTDPDGPTPEIDQEEEEEVDPDDVEGIKELMSKDDLPRPILHQPWRLGNTAGCEAPIDAEWRQEAEQIIETSVNLVGGKVLDVTWYLTQVIVTLDENITIAQPQDLFKSSGPVIEVEDPQDPQYFDPNDPDPDVILDPDEVVYQRQTAEEMEDEKERNSNRWAAKDDEDPPEEPHNPLEEAEPQVPLYMNEVVREEAVNQALEEEQERYDDAPKPFDMTSIVIDTAALSTIAGAILEGLEEVEEELNILSRHELVLTSPGAPDVLETQKQFNAFRGANVIVETQDPWESNRTLKGQLVDRNSMDLIINQKGRMVTIPLCFVKCVRIPRKVKSSQGTAEDDDYDDDDDDDDGDDEDENDDMDNYNEELFAYEEERANGSPMP